MKLTRDHFVSWVRAKRRVRCHQPFDLTVNFWAEASVLAAARLLSNHDVRSDHSEREDNEGIDLMGAASELLLSLLLERYRDCCAEVSIEFDDPRASPAVGLEKMRASMFVMDGGRNAQLADLSFGDDGRCDTIDAKSFDFQPQHKLFAINAKKHSDLRKAWPEYFCFLAPKFSDCAHVAFVSYEAVDRWESKVLVTKPKPKPPARILPMHEFCPRHMGTDFDALKKTPRQPFTLDAVGAASSESGAGRLRALLHMPQLGVQIADDRFAQALGAILTGSALTVPRRQRKG